MADGRFETAGVEFFGEFEERFGVFVEKGEFEDGLRVGEVVFLEVVVQACAGRAEIGDAGS